MSGIGDCWLPPPGLGVEHRWRMHTLWMNQELWSNKLLHTQQDLWEENLGKTQDSIEDIFCTTET